MWLKHTGVTPVESSVSSIIPACFGVLVEVCKQETVKPRLLLPPALEQWRQGRARCKAAYAQHLRCAGRSWDFAWTAKLCALSLLHSHCKTSRSGLAPAETSIIHPPSNGPNRFQHDSRMGSWKRPGAVSGLDTLSSWISAGMRHLLVART